MFGKVTDIAEARRRRLTPTGRALLGTWELASSLSPYGPEPPSEELLTCMLTLPPSDRAEMAEILGAKALEIEKLYSPAFAGGIPVSPSSRRGNPVMVVSSTLSTDHRVVDGADGARVL